MLSPGQGRNEVIWLGEGVLVNIQYWVCCDLVVLAQPESPILLWNNNNRGSPLAVGHGAENTAVLQSLQLKIYCLLDRERDRSSLTKLGVWRRSELAVWP